VTILRNSFDGGTDTTVITTANSGGSSGDAFNSVSGSPTFTTAQVLAGTVSCKFVQAGAAAAYLGWPLVHLTQYQYARYYLMMEAWPSVATPMCYFMEDGPIMVAELVMGTDGLITVKNNAGTATATTPVAVNPEVMYRIEARCDGLPSGSGTVYVYEGHATQAITSASVTGDFSFVGWDVCRIGTAVTSTTVTWTVYLDDLAVGETGWVGPSQAPNDPALSRAIFIGGV
jgi:hypothetical protein